MSNFIIELKQFAKDQLYWRPVSQHVVALEYTPGTIYEDGRRLATIAIHLSNGQHRIIQAKPELTESQCAMLLENMHYHLEQSNV
jgi:hypothetical protein